MINLCVLYNKKFKDYPPVSFLVENILYEASQIEGVQVDVVEYDVEKDFVVCKDVYYICICVDFFALPVEWQHMFFIITNKRMMNSVLLTSNVAGLTTYKSWKYGVSSILGVKLVLEAMNSIKVVSDQISGYDCEYVYAISSVAESSTQLVVRYMQFFEKYN